MPAAAFARDSRRLAAIALSALAVAQADRKPAPLTGEAAGIKKILEQKFPGAEVRGVTKTAYFGLYEVQFDDRIVYTDAKAKYLLVGAVYDTESKLNLTEERQRKLNRVDVAQLPLDMAIKKVKGTGERTMYRVLRCRLPVLRQARAGAQERRQRDDLHVPVPDRQPASRRRAQVAHDLVRRRTA